MRGFTFIYDGGTFHTGDTFGLLQQVKDISGPEVQSHFLEVPGRNGKINMTNVLTGYPCYNNRTIELTYFYNSTWGDMIDIRAVLGRMHGKTVKAIDDDTPDYYYTGEVYVDFEQHPTYLIITVQIDAEPFRYELEYTEVSVDTQTCPKWTQLVPEQVARYEHGVYMSKQGDNYLLSGVHNSEMPLRFTVNMASRKPLNSTHVYYFGSGSDNVALELFADDQSFATDDSECIRKPPAATSDYIINLKMTGGVRGIYETVTPVVVDLTLLFGSGNEPTEITDEKINTVKTLLKLHPAYTVGTKCALLNAGDNAVEPVVLVGDPSSDSPDLPTMTINVNGRDVAVRSSTEPISETLRPGPNMITFTDTRHLVLQFIYRRGWL